MYKKAWCTCKVIVLQIKLIVFLTFSLPSASLDLKVAISLVVKLNEDFNFLLCCAIHVGEIVGDECEPFYVTVLSTRSRMYKMILKL